jgi:hypothetical protein
MKRRHFLPILFAGLAAPVLALETSYDADRILKKIQGKDFKYCTIRFKIIFADQEFEADYQIKKIGAFTNAQLEIIKEDLSGLEAQDNFVKWLDINYQKPQGKSSFTIQGVRIDCLDSFSMSVFETKMSCFDLSICILTSVEFPSSSVFLEGKKLNRTRTRETFNIDCQWLAEVAENLKYEKNHIW